MRARIRAAVIALLPIAAIAIWGNRWIV